MTEAYFQSPLPQYYNMAVSDRLYKKGSLFKYFTFGYNIIEVIASIIFGSIPVFLTLFGFGLVSMVESISGLGLI